MKVTIANGLTPFLVVLSACAERSSSQVDSTEPPPAAVVDAAADAEACMSWTPPGPEGSDGGSLSFSVPVVQGEKGNVFSGAPLPDVSVCLGGPTGDRIAGTCAVTGEDGIVEMTGLSIGREYVVRLDKAGFVPVAVPVATVPGRGALQAPIRMISAADLDALLGDFGPRRLGERGIAAISAVHSRSVTWTTDVSFSSCPAPMKPAAYVDAADQVVPGADATVGGWGAWLVDLPPGIYTAETNDLTCDAAPILGRGWPSYPGSVRFPVFAGALTQSAGFYCDN